MVDRIRKTTLSDIVREWFDNHTDEEIDELLQEAERESNPAWEALWEGEYSDFDAPDAHPIGGGAR